MFLIDFFYKTILGVVVVGCIFVMYSFVGSILARLDLPFLEYLFCKSGTCLRPNLLAVLSQWEVMLKLINFLVFANCQILKLPDLRDVAAT